MSRHILAVVIVGTLSAVTACGEAPGPLAPSVTAPQLAQSPADGSGNKQVFVISGPPVSIDCGGQTIVRHITGWTQVIFEDRDQRNVRLQVFHTNFIFTNSAGDQFIWHDVGPDHVYVSDGQLFVAIIGRTSGHIGRLVVDLATGNVVFEAGRDIGLPRELACAKLT